MTEVLMRLAALHTVAGPEVNDPEVDQGLSRLVDAVKSLRPLGDTGLNTAVLVEVVRETGYAQVQATNRVATAIERLAQVLATRSEHML